ncbi:unnamed protein product [Closterium sp. Yama58-4]|nr:unnamed protein product [Closterium sp. Yama58-4]
MRRAVTVTPRKALYRIASILVSNRQQRVVTSMERKQQVLGFAQRKPVGERQGKHGSGSGKQTDWKAAEEPGNEVQNDAIIAPPQEQAEQAERALQLFDMDMAFGPCTGLSRLERWQRANRLGLNPPAHVQALLESASCREDSVWEGRVLRLGQPAGAQPSALTYECCWSVLRAVETASGRAGCEGWPWSWQQGCINGWVVYGCMGGWVHGRVGVLAHGCVGAWAHGRMGAWMATASAPIVWKEALSLTNLGVNQRFINFTHVTMESEKYICVRETAPSNSVVIIDMAMPMQPLRRPFTADSALINPDSKILALKALIKGTNQMRILDIEARAEFKSYRMPEKIVYWKWISNEVLGLVTLTSVYHWSIEGEVKPVKMFERTANLNGSQIINYRSDPSGKWLALIGIAPGAPERPQLVKGNMQLFSVDEQKSQALEAHVAAFASVKVPGNDTPSLVIAFATKTITGGQLISRLHIMELGAQPGRVPFTKKQADLFFPPAFADDFPISMQVSAKFGLVYVVTKLGLLFVYDLESATAIYHNRISPDPIFLAADAPSVGGVYAVNLRGKVLLATVNEQAIVPFVSGQLNNSELAINLARRANLPGAENLVPRSSSPKDVVVAEKSVGSQSPAAAGRSGEKGRRFSLKENLGSWFRSQPGSSNSVDRTATAITHQSLAKMGMEDGEPPRIAPAYTPCAFEGESPGPRCGHTLTAVTPIGEPGSANYIGPRLILFGGAAAMERGKGPAAGAAALNRKSGSVGRSLAKRLLDRLSPVGKPPSPRAAHAAAAMGTMVVIQGGIGPTGLATDDLHVLDLTQAQPKWHGVAVQGAGPGPRYGHVMALVGQRYLLCISGNDGKRLLSDVWLLDTTVKPYKWKKLDPKGEGPPPCMYATASARHDGLLLLCGGRDSSGVPLPGAFRLARHLDGRWEWAVAPGVSPSARYQHAAMFVGLRLHVSGGTLGEERMVEDASSVAVLDTAAGVWCDRKAIVSAARTGRYSADAPGCDASSELTCRCRHAAASVGDFIFVYGGLRGGILLDDLLIADDTPPEQPTLPPSVGAPAKEPVSGSARNPPMLPRSGEGQQGVAVALAVAAPDDREEDIEAEHANDHLHEVDEESAAAAARPSSAAAEGEAAAVPVAAAAAARPSSAAGGPAAAAAAAAGRGKCAGVEVGMDVAQPYVFREYSLAELTKATGEWAEGNRIGSGGFGAVYKAVSPHDGNQAWAVKRARVLTNDFHREVKEMASKSHPHLVRLLGYCIDFDPSTRTMEQLLVYELMPNGDLDRWIGPGVSNPLSLQQRLDVLIGAAKGLQYLHDFNIVHRDIKPANILLDRKMQAKVADFGLVKLLGGTSMATSEAATRLVGTLGYMDPEYCSSHIPSPAVDVYSFGVVMLVVLTGRKAVLVIEDDHVNIKRWVAPLVISGAVAEFKDPRSEAPDGLVLHLARLALSCTALPGVSRPSMLQVLAELVRIKQETFGVRASAEVSGIDTEIGVSDGSYNFSAEMARAMQEAGKSDAASHNAGNAAAAEAIAARGGADAGKAECSHPSPGGTNPTAPARRNSNEEIAQATLPPFAEPLPLLKDVGAQEQQALFIRKLRLCSYLFDFNDPMKNVKEKEIKRQTLLELVGYIESRKFNVALGDIRRMLEINLFRPLTRSAHGGEMPRPTMEAAWPHLELVYEFLLRYVVSEDTYQSHCINQNFILNLLNLFDSEDPRERKCVETSLNWIYDMFNVHRPFIREAIGNIVHRFKLERRNGITEIFRFAIVKGFELPFGEQDKKFLGQALFLLHKPRCLHMYHHQPSYYCIIQFVEKDPELAEPVLRGLLKFWPLTDSQEEVLFLEELEEVLKETQLPEFQMVMTPLFQQIARCLSSSHFQVVERTLRLWNHHYIKALVARNHTTIMPLIFAAIMLNINRKWKHQDSKAVNSLATKVHNTFLERKVDEVLYNDCMRLFLEEGGMKTILFID